MSKNITDNILRFFAVIAYLFMVTVNILANTIPINGLTTGEISDYYQNLFTPAAYTFLIWFLIYILLAMYAYYQFIHYKEDLRLYRNINTFFIISSVANGLWIISWHYQIILLSLIFIVIMLICLIFISNSLISTILTHREKLFVRLPFSIYYGWITVAAIANFVVLMVSLNLYGFLIPESISTIVLLLAGAAVGIYITLRNNDIAYGLVLLWAYIGILVKHLSQSGFDGQYKSVIITLTLCILLFLLSLGLVYLKINKKLVKGVYRIKRK